MPSLSHCNILKSIHYIFSLAITLFIIIFKFQTHSVIKYYMYPNNISLMTSLTTLKTFLGLSKNIQSHIKGANVFILCPRLPRHDTTTQNLR